MNLDVVVFTKLITLTVDILAGHFSSVIFLTHNIINFWELWDDNHVLRSVMLNVWHMYNDRLDEAKIKYLHFYDMKYAVLGKCVSNKHFGWLLCYFACLDYMPLDLALTVPCIVCFSLILS